MQSTFKVALPGYNAFTDTNPDHFSLFVDQRTDYILIKEKLAATVSVNGITNVAHGLGYVPFCLVFAELQSGNWRKLFSTPIDNSGCSFSIDSTNLILSNTLGSAKNFTYHIFYDDIV